MMRALKKILFCVIAFVIGIGAVGAAAPETVYAADWERKFDTTDVMDDLTSSTVGGQAFELKDYPFDESKRAQIICFAEYCYSFRANMRGNYGLYVYVYNPQGLNLSEQSKRNKIQMAVKYDTDGNPSDYEKFDLQFLSKSETPDYMNLFYKFKITDKAIDGKTFADRVNSNARRYDVSGMELLSAGAENATDYPVNGTYTFTGYSAGYGPEPDGKHAVMRSRISRNRYVGRKAYVLPHGNVRQGRGVPKPAGYGILRRAAALFRYVWKTAANQSRMV